LGLASLEEYALSSYESILILAFNATRVIIGSNTIGRKSQTYSVDALLVIATSCLERAMASVVKIPTSLTLIAMTTY
jgi:hypothetical protein